MIGSAVNAFSEMSAYPLYVTEDTRLLMVQTLEVLVLRANAVKILSSDPLFVKDFVVLLGNLLDSTSEGGQAAASRRRLQTAADPSTQLRSLLRTENRVLDALCASATADGAPVHTYGDVLEVTVQKVPADFATREQAFVNQDGSVQMNVPLDELLSQAQA